MFVTQSRETIAARDAEAVICVDVHGRECSEERFPDQDLPVAAAWEHVEADFASLSTERDASEPCSVRSLGRAVAHSKVAL